jgi:hypothetical protein
VLYYWLVLVYSVCLSLGNIYKEMGIITLPASVLVFIYIIWTQKIRIKQKTKFFVFSVLILIISTLVIGKVSDSLVSYYAKGPVDHYKTGYFIATGLSFETNGRYNPQVASNFLSPLKAAVANGSVGDSVYKQADKAVLEAGLEKVRQSPSNLPKLFASKFNTVWSNDNEINNWNYDNYILTSALPPNETLAQLKSDLGRFNLMSNAYLLFVIALAFVGSLFIALDKKTEPDAATLVSALVIFGFAGALLIIEVLTRYRSILYPSLCLLAIYGLVFVVKNLQLRS